MSDAGNKDNSTARIGRRKLALLLKLAAALAVLAVLLIILDFCSCPLLNPPERSAAFNKGCNGIWLRYYWYRGKHSDAEFKVMLQKLRRGQIKYAFFHVLRVNPDGSLKYKNVQNACKITDGIHKEAQGVKAIAWVYVPSRLNGPDGADLSQPGVRRNLIEVAKWLVRDCHFDGVQWDYEFCA